MDDFNRKDRGYSSAERRREILSDPHPARQCFNFSTYELRKTV